MTYAQGEDRSGYQRVLPWTGDSFGFCKAAEGDDWEDPTFAVNWAALAEAGIPRGAYHFFHPAQDPVKQAKFFVSTVQRRGLQSGDILIADVEITVGEDGTEDFGTGRAGARMHTALGRTHRTVGAVGDSALVFLDEVTRLAGAQNPVLIYSGLFMAQEDLGACAGYPLFVADFAAAPPASVAPWPTWTFWQSEDGGGHGGGDTDCFNGDEAALLEWLAAYDGANWTENLVENLPTLQLGSEDGAPDTTWYVHRLRNELAGYGRWNGLGAVTALPDGGVFDMATQRAVEAVQGQAGLVKDGVAGPKTWAVLIG
jgi:lysozyme